MDELIKAIDNYQNGTRLIYEYEDGGIILGETDTIYEADNGVDYLKQGYEEYYIAVIKVLDIIQPSKSTSNLQLFRLIEINYRSLISKIKLENSGLIWNK